MFASVLRRVSVGYGIRVVIKVASKVVFMFHNEEEILNAGKIDYFCHFT